VELGVGRPQDSPAPVADLLTIRPGFPEVRREIGARVPASLLSLTEYACF
jgi:hypothetical protein